MKKLFMMVAACAVIASCNQTGKNAKVENPQDSVMSVDTTAAAAGVTYSGTIPAADGPGIKYTVTLSGDSAKTFKMEEVYLQAKDGKDDVKTYTGAVENMKKDVERKAVTAYKLPMDKDNALYLLVKDDATLSVVNDQLEEAASGNDYTLKLVK